MTARVERLVAPLRVASEEIAASLVADLSDVNEVMAPRVSGLGYRLDTDDALRRLAWFLIGEWLLGFLLKAVPLEATLRDAEQWFYGESANELPKLAPSSYAMKAFGESTSPAEVFALFPYLLDPLKPGTRRSALKDETHVEDRLVRKAGGVYYTPGDVAEFMVARIKGRRGAAWLDPACGSGVFLRQVVSSGVGLDGVFGVDVSPMAVEAATFVLLAIERTRPRIPWARWHQVRVNLATQDALLLQPGTALGVFEQAERQRELELAKSALAVRTLLPAPVEHQSAPECIGELFPRLVHGADAYVTNPPYAMLGYHPRRADIQKRFAVARDGLTSATNVYPLFVEQSWRLTSRVKGRSSVVVPLSVAYSRNGQIARLREEMVLQEGRWDFYFFDRAPDALFGDDVKTRNAIIVHAFDAPRKACTSSLSRWTSRNRRLLFASLTPVEIASDIRRVIPKVGSSFEARTYTQLRGSGLALGPSLLKVGTAKTLAEVEMLLGESVLIGPTAYNWLNTVRDSAFVLQAGHSSKSPFTCLTVSDEARADALYAMLSSRLTYWLWRVEGDGFHVNKSFLASLPYSLNVLGPGDLGELAKFGRELWKRASSKPSLSTNKGRVTAAFPPIEAPDVLNEIDGHLISLLGLPEMELEAWYERTIIVDEGDDQRRRRLRGLGR